MVYVVWSLTVVDAAFTDRPVRVPVPGAIVTVDESMS